MQFQDHVSAVNGVVQTPQPSGRLPSIFVTYAEGRHAYMGSGDPAQRARFVFHRRRRDGSYQERPSKPPGRLTWRGKARRAKAAA